MMPLDETLNIDTPENVTFDYDIAGIASRFAAALIDTILIVLLQVIANLLILLVVSRLLGIEGGEGLQALGAWVVALVGLVSFLFLWGYYIFFEMLWNGQTPGKKAIHLRVIRTDGTAITLTESVIRNLVRLVDFLPVFYGIGTVAIFINRQTRRLGDLAAGTLVVREKSQQITLSDLAAMHSAIQTGPAGRPGLAEPGAQAGLAAGDPTAGAEQAQGLAVGSLNRKYPVERLDYQDIQMIESYLRRQKELVNREALAWHLLKRMLVKMGIDPSNAVYQESETALRTIIEEYRQQKP